MPGNKAAGSKEKGEEEEEKEIRLATLLECLHHVRPDLQ